MKLMKESTRMNSNVAEVEGAADQQVEPAKTHVVDSFIKTWYLGVQQLHQFFDMEDET